MIVKEIKEAVIDVINFIMPPVFKLLITYYLVQFVTFDTLTHRWLSDLGAILARTKLDDVQQLITKFNLSSIVPIIFILILILGAYIVNRITSYIGWLIPIRFVHYSHYMVDKYMLRTIWEFFPDVMTLGELETKMDVILRNAGEKDLASYKDNLKWQNEKWGKIFTNVTFCYFLMVAIVAGSYVAKHYYYFLFSNTRLYVVLFLLVIIVVCFYLQLAQIQKERSYAKLRYIDTYLRQEHGISLYTDGKILDGIRERIEQNFKYYEKWWRLDIGYRINWLSLYKNYDDFRRVRWLVRDIKYDLKNNRDRPAFGLPANVRYRRTNRSYRALLKIVFWISGIRGKK